jgi:DNA-binding protein H-NS
MQDFSKYSLPQLRQLEAQLLEELKTRHLLSVSQAREQILHIARSAGVSVRDLLAGKAPKIATERTVPVKYRDPDDATKQWSGRGRQPGWIKEWLSSGKSLDQAKI